MNPDRAQKKSFRRSVNSKDLVSPSGSGVLGSSGGTISSGVTNEMHTAIQSGDVKRLKKLFSSKKKAAVMLTEEDENQLTPLLLAAKTEQIESLDLILKFMEKSKTLDINQQAPDGSCILHLVMSLAADAALIRMLQFPLIQVDIGNREGTTPLHYFCHYFTSPSCQEPFRMLIKKGAKVNVQNSHGETPLHKAIFNSSVRVILIELLLQEGADINLRTNRGVTALHFAVNLGRNDIISLLLRHGADLTIKQRDGLTALDVATQLHNGVEKRLRMAEDLRQWLENIGLAEYLNLFLKEDLYIDVMVDMTDSLLLKIGVNSSGHRLQILQACTALKARKQEQNPDNLEDLLDRGQSAQDCEKMYQSLQQISGLQEGWHIRQQDLEFTQKVGSGGAGKVYKGIYKESVPVAIKVLKNTELKQLDEFKKEVEIMNAIRGKEIVRFFGMSLEPRLCMVMEFCTRGSLFHVMNLDVDFGWDLLLKFALQTATGMDLLHSWDPQIVHRDVKSLNLLVTEDWDLKVCDFGLSRFTTAENQDTLTKLRGTPAYCAPEIIFGSRFTTKSDVYGMGIVYWEMVQRCMTGKYRRPYADHPEIVHDFQILIQAAQQGTRPSIPEDCPKSVAFILKQCVLGDPEARPTCRELIQLLTACIDEGLEKLQSGTTGKERQRSDSDVSSLKDSNNTLTSLRSDFSISTPRNEL
eukprot:TRINITY_DN8503_c0_g1_i2.p1 TRINITY_DN8503_c0_g1~~TRINITY_DN8503_c0_g1_i2.p1  ORF type:complete len:696 (-),score=115.98 TRINITY_DN8503_c0_g1_i2:42-2129(-)